MYLSSVQVGIEGLKREEEKEARGMAGRRKEINEDEREEGTRKMGCEK